MTRPDSRTRPHHRPDARPDSRAGDDATATAFGRPWRPEDGVPPRRPQPDDSAAVCGEALWLASADIAAATIARLFERPDAAWRGRVASWLETSLAAAQTALWRGGWQPADVHRLARRKSKTVALVAADVMTLELQAYAPATVDPRFRDQLADLDATPWWPPSSGPLRARVAGADWPSVAAAAVQLLALWRTLPPVQRLCAIPGEARAGSASTSRAAGPVDDRVLARVRALLAKAESTQFEAEADAFTAGAQALMTRYSIDRAMLSHEQPAGGDEPGALRIGIDNPYEQQKALLLSCVADANGCRSVWAQKLAFCTVVGFPAELAAVESLFTSLLLQATSSLARNGSRRSAWGGSRTRAFRASFLEAFACRIGERLSEAAATETDRAVREEGRGRDLVPVLAARRDETEAAFERMFPETVQTASSRMFDREGWSAGAAAADLAHLSWGSQVDR